jgi:peroxiredoxin family protein
MCDNNDNQEYKDWLMQQRWEKDIPIVLEPIKNLQNALQNEQITECGVDGLNMANESACIQKNDKTGTILDINQTLTREMGINICSSCANVDLSDTSRRHNDDDDDLSDNYGGIGHLMNEIENGSILAVFKFRKLMRDALGEVPDEMMEYNDNSCVSQNMCVPADAKFITHQAPASLYV